MAEPKKLRSDTALLRQKSKLITIMRDNAGENSSHTIEKFIQSKDGGGDWSPQDRHSDRFGDKMIYQHSAVDYERRGKEQHKGAMAMVTNNSAKEEGIRTSDSKLQMFAAGTPDLKSGAKTAARYSKN